MSKSYVEYCVDDIQIRNLQKLESKWSSDGSLLAVSVYSLVVGGTVKILNENGFLVETQNCEIPTKSAAKVAAFAWHPKQTTIAVVWENYDFGCFTVRNANCKWFEVVEDDEAEFCSSKVTKMQWIANGEGLITVTENGCVKLFSYDSMSGSMIKSNVHQLSDKITDAIAVRPETKNSVLYFGSNTGMVYQMFSSADSASDIIQLESAIRRLLFYSRRNRLVIISENLMLCQYTISLTSNEVSEVSKVKLSSSVKNATTDAINVLMIDKDIGLIAICVTGERVVKLWQLETGHNAAVIVVESVDSHWAGVSTLDYCNDLLVAGTSNNQVIVWKRNIALEFNKISQVQLKGNVRHISVSEKIIACCSNSNELYFIEEQNMCSAFSEQFVVLQTAAKVMKVFSIANKWNVDVNTESPIRYLLLSSNAKYMAVKTTGIKETHFYKINSKAVELTNSCVVNEPLTCLAIHDNTILNLNTNFCENIEKNSVSISIFNVEEGNTNPTIYQIDFKSLISKQSSVKLISFDLNAHFLLIIFSTQSTYIYFVFEVKTKSLQLITGPETFECRKSIKNAKINFKGTLFAFVEEKNIAVVKIGSNELMKLECNIDENISPLFWAQNEERLVCFKNSNYVSIIICSIEEMVLRHYDQFPTNIDSMLIGLEVPNIYFFEGNDSSEISKHTLTEFEGLSLATIKVMIDFLTSSSLDLNEMIKTIDQRGENNEKLWMNLARISVKCRDINMGLYCMSKLKNARVVKDVKKELVDSSSVDAALSVLAMNVGLNSEAEELLKSSGNQLKLSKFYQTQNEWNKAIECVDKLNLKTVYYDYAKYFEVEEENLQEAIKYFEKSGTNVFEVPRLLFDMDGNTILQNYCLNDALTANVEEKRKLIQWWGQYCESLGDVSAALNSYEKAEDYYNFVRLLCYTGDIEKAKTFLQQMHDSENTTKAAALLHIGRHEETSNPSEAISYYLSCGAVNHAIRVCKANNMKQELIKIVVNYGTKIDAKELIDKHIDDEYDSEISGETITQLYCKAEITDKAVEYCLRNNLWSALRQILHSQADKLQQGSHVDPISDSTLELAFDVLRSNSDIVDIIIDLLLLRNDKKSLISELIVEYNIEINERLVEKIERLTHVEPNSKLMQMLADLSLKQGQYITSAKLFNSVGDRVSAIKALIRTGDNDKIINYANIARDKSVYKICANYLQTCSYKDDNVIAKFYKKANATEELQRFLSDRNN
ncbi:intraflagellar transport protein 140-like protein [Leptotrombidium deliense]|uniref:Intraflagellar transport protein 140-like protein n=1 Tax=Leptotrombidium deliense TaxID=299467 RepID=A0A443SMG7_9ACAR|nr:intraflagellar transport protein 140-like protein [Leptotrombidium deliense]